MSSHTTEEQKNYQKLVMDALNFIAPTHPVISPPSPPPKMVDAQLTPGRRNLRSWLGKTFRVVISDGRILVGFFNCTDKDANVVLSMCSEYVEEGKDARILGNVMIPGKHIVSISVDMPNEEQIA